MEEIKREQVNAASITNAIGWSGLFNGFAKETDKKLEPQQILPYPTEAKQKDKMFSDKTIATVKRLARNNKLPQQLYLTLRQIEEVGI